MGVHSKKNRSGPSFHEGVASPEAIGCQLSGPRPHVSNGANKPEWAVGQDPNVGLIRKHGLAKHHSAHRDGHVHIAFFNRVTRPLAIDQRASLRAVMTVTALGALRMRLVVSPRLKPLVNKVFVPHLVLGSATATVRNPALLPPST